MNYMNNRRIEARKYFGILNDPNMVLHHKDVTLKYNDPDRYKEWRIEDLEVMTREDHVRLHNPFLGHNHNDDTKEKISNTLKGRKLSDSHRKNLSESKKNLYKNNSELVKKRSDDMKRILLAKKIDYHIVCRKCGEEFLSKSISYRYCENCRGKR